MHYSIYHYLSYPFCYKKLKIKRKEQKAAWESLFRKYLIMDDSPDIFKLFRHAAYEHDIKKDYDNWFWLSYMCLLLQYNQKSKADELLEQYTRGINGTKHIELFLPVAALAVSHGIKNRRIEMASAIFECLEKHRLEKTFEKLITGKTVAIVGNGPCETGLNKGLQIDDHDIVIRFNNFEINGYEKDYGSRTDIWIRGFAGTDVHDKTATERFLFAGISGNYLFYPLFSENQLNILWRDLVKNPITSSFVSCELYRSIHNTFHGEPSTGLASIYACLNMPVKQIDLYGFSYLQKQPDPYASHYFNDRNETEALKRSINHNFNDETLYLRRLLHGK